MHFDEVYHARTATEFLQDWRYGDVARHLRVDPPAPGQVRAWPLGIVLWGEDHVSATSDLGVPVRASVIEPRRDDETLPGGRAGERLHVATGTEIRTYDLRSRELDLDDPGAGRQRPGDRSDRRAARRRLRRRTRRDARSRPPSGPMPPRPGVTPQPPWPGRRTPSASPASPTTARPSWSARATGSTALDLVDGRRPRVASTCPASRTSPTAAPARRSWRHRRRSRTTPPRPRRWPSSSAAMRPTYRGEPRRRPSTTVVLGSPGTGETRTRSRRAIADGRLPGVEIGTSPGSRSATTDGVTFIDPAGRSVISTRRDGRRRPRPRRGHRHRRPEAVRHGRTADDAGLRRHRGRRRRGQGRPGRPGQPPAARPRHEGRLRRGEPDGPHPGARPGRRPAPDRPALDGLRRRAAREPSPRMRSTPTRGCPTGFAPAAWAMDVERRVPVRRPPAAPRVRPPTARSASIEVGSHAFAWRLPGVIAGALTAACLYLLARILFRRRLVAGLVARVRAGRRDVLRPVADRHERRLRRPVHRRGLHALRRGLDGLVARPGGVLGRRCRVIGAAARPRAREQVGRGLRDRRRSPC